MGNWIADNLDSDKICKSICKHIYQTIDGGSYTFTIAYNDGAVRNNIIPFNNCINVQFDDFCNKYEEFFRKVNVQPDTKRALFMSHAIKNNKGSLSLITEMIKKKYPYANEYGLNIVVNDPFQILNIAISPYLNKLEDDSITLYNGGANSVRYQRKGRYCIQFVRSLLDFNPYFISYSKLIQPNQALEVDDNLDMKENIKQTIMTSVVNIQNFLEYIVHPKNKKFVDDVISTINRAFYSKMTRSSFNKLISFSNKNDAVVLSNIVEHRRITQEYVEDDIKSYIYKAIARIETLKLKPLESFAVTIEGVQFKITNLESAKYSKGLEYGRALRFDVNINFTTFKTRHIINWDYNKKDWVPIHVTLPFYNILKEMGGEKIFMDKLEMNAFANL